MSFRHAKYAEISVNANLLRAFCDAYDLSIDVDTAETTTYSATWKTYLPGIAGATFEIGGKYDPTATTGPVAVLTGLIGADPFAVIGYPGGNTAGQIQHQFNAIITSYKESSPMSGPVAFKASMIATGAVTSTVIGA